jgi:anti-sigma regulatory factor (Ser/Thr protein kinase)
MQAFQVRTSLDVFAPRQAALGLAQKLGFPRHERQEVAIAVSELASNIVKYGVRGSIEISSLEDPRHGVGLVIVARDVGPPFRNLAMALQDGCDDDGPIDPGLLLKRAGLGIGLGAVVRFTDSFDVEHGKVGKEIRVVRYRVRPRRAG